MRLPVPKRVVDWIVRRAERTPYFHLAGYMERYWLWRIGNAPAHSRYGVRGAGWFSGRIHHILRSDLDRDLHDHPQDYVTIILRGGYREFRAEIIDNRPQIVGRWHGPGTVLFRFAEDPHRLEVPPGTVTTTLFITGPRRRTWGFHTRDGWVPWREYEARADRAPYAPGINDDLNKVIGQAINAVHDTAARLRPADPTAAPRRSEETP